MRQFLSKLDSHRIVEAIAAAEKKSSGEIRVHVTRRKPDNLEERARRRFELLGMTKTAHRNGVLIYIAPKMRRFQILGDTGIHEKCGDDFWKETAAELEIPLPPGRVHRGHRQGHREDRRRSGDPLSAEDRRRQRAARRSNGGLIDR